MKPFQFALLAAVALGAAAAIAPVTEANHTKRIVLPFGQAERWIPVIAGYEVAPRPLDCGVGTIDTSTGSVLYANTFTGGLGDVTLAKNILQVDNPAAYYNDFHYSTFKGRGTSNGHSAGGELYFGRETFNADGSEGSGTMRPVSPFTYYRLGGTASVPALTVPTTPTYVSWKDKFEVEGLFGYDHMWMEMVDQADGKVYILCSTDTDFRPDKSSTDDEISTCSPYRLTVCPVGVHGDGGTGLGVDLKVLPTSQLDPTAPHWENRYVQLPADFAGHTVTLRFSYDSADGVANGYMGYMLDDVQIAQGVPIPDSFVYVPVPPV